MSVCKYTYVYKLKFYIRATFFHFYSKIYSENKISSKFKITKPQHVQFWHTLQFTQ